MSYMPADHMEADDWREAKRASDARKWEEIVVSLELENARLRTAVASKKRMPWEDAEGQLGPPQAAAVTHIVTSYVMCGGDASTTDGVTCEACLEVFARLTGETPRDSEDE